MRIDRFAALIAVLAVNSPILAQGGTRGGAPGRGLLEVVAQGGRGGVCQSRPWSSYGIASMRCESCAMEGRELKFDAEPVVESIVANSNTLRAGDVILAVNGKPITTAEGGAAFSTPLVPQTTLTVRRSGTRVEVPVTVSASCAPGTFHVNAEKVQLDQGRTTMTKAVMTFQPAAPGVSQGRGGGAGGSTAAAAQMQAQVAALEAELRRMQAMRTSDTTLQRSLARMQDHVRQLNAAAADAAASAARVAELNAVIAATAGRGGRGAGGRGAGVMSADTARLSALNRADSARARGRGAVAPGRGGRGAPGRGVAGASVSALSRPYAGISLDCDQSCGPAGTNPILFRRLPNITAIAPGSPAAGAGLRAGDQLVAVNGIRIAAVPDPSGLTRPDAGTAELARVWLSGTDFKLTVLRDAKEIEVTIRP